jgi:mannitol/fructose-specific phosphotransferase system IIA component (Ntr-type)
LALACVDLTRLVDPARVLLGPTVSCRLELLRTLAPLTVNGSNCAGDRFLSAILAREQVASTAIGGAVAVPHARVAPLDACRMSLAVLPDGLSWDAPDGQPVRLVAMLAVREEDHAEHLRVLATLATRLRDPVRLSAVLSASDAVEVLEGISR